MAVPIPIVNVGVTKIRILFIFESIPRYHHAPLLNDEFPQAAPLLAHGAIEKLFAQIGLTGHIIGSPRVQGAVQQVIVKGRQVRAANIGSHSSILSPSPYGVPRTDISFPGASGAQFIGDETHPPQPNPHESPSARFCITVSICFSTFGLNPIVVSCPVGLTLTLSILLPLVLFVFVMLLYVFVNVACAQEFIVLPEENSILSGIPFPFASASFAARAGERSAGVNVRIHLR